MIHVDNYHQTIDHHQAVDNHNQDNVPTRGEKALQVAMIPVGIILSLGITQLVGLVALPVIGCKAIHLKKKEKFYTSELLKVKEPSEDFTNANALFTAEDRPFLELNAKLLDSQSDLAHHKALAIAFSFGLIPLAGMHVGMNYFVHKNKHRDDALQLWLLSFQNIKHINKLNKQAENLIGLEEITL